MNSKFIDNIWNISVQDTLHKICKSDMLNEMAITIKSYKHRVDGLRFQLVENWCLCKYCQLFDPESENFIHWATELKACIDNLKFLSLKSGQKSNILKRMLIDDYDYNDANMIASIIADKFSIEHIPVDKRKAVALAFSSNVNGLIDVISDLNLSVATYIRETFA